MTNKRIISNAALLVIIVFSFACGGEDGPATNTTATVTTTSTPSPTATLTAPSSLSYGTTFLVKTVGQSVSIAAPTVTGSSITYSISPALPSGVAINSSTGSISGTPTAQALTADYTVTATNSGGSTTASIKLTFLPQKRIAGGYSHFCGIYSNALKCWGDNQYGQLGIGNQLDKTTPTSVSSLSSAVTYVTAAYYSSCAIKSGTIYCWGYNDNGQLGDGSTSNATNPAAVLGLSSNMVKVEGSSTGKHYCGLTELGTIKCWGDNTTNGQLGNNSTTDSSTPVSVVDSNGDALSEVVDIAVGGSHSCAITSNLNLYCWGYNGYGQLGIGNTSIKLVPSLVSGSSASAKLVWAGTTHTCALINSTLKCWGHGGNGRLGTGFTADETTPSTVVGLSTPSIASIGNSNSCSISTAGALKCWGNNNDYGQVGNGSSTDQSSPVAVSLSNIVDLGVGGFTTCAINSSDSTYCWGFQGDGQLGNGLSTGNSSTPTLAN